MTRQVAPGRLQNVASVFGEQASILGKEALAMPRAPKRAEVLLRHVLPQANFALAGSPRVTRVCSDPHRCRPGDTFVPLLEANVDGHDLADLAVANGASLVVAEQYVPVSVPTVLVKDTREALGRLSHALVGDPSKALRSIAIAGSAGKTVMSMLLASVLEKAGRHVGVMSTLGYSDSITQVEARVTTPKAPVLATWMSRMVENGCDDALIEVSAKSLAERRLAGAKFDGFIVHNLQAFPVQRVALAFSFRS
ncbi:MAG: Mur ligase family protein [Pirellulales bacterium]